VKRSAQDDVFVGVLKKNIPNNLALMGRSPGQESEDDEVPKGQLKINSEIVLGNV
jgi:hypothetical protein